MGWSKAINCLIGCSAKSRPRSRDGGKAPRAPEKMERTMKPITPHLWFEKEAKEAAQFYCAVFPNSKITSVRTLRDTPSGECDVVAFELNGQPFMAISAGPLFKFNESISFMVSCETQAEI